VPAGGAAAQGAGRAASEAGSTAESADAAPTAEPAVPGEARSPDRPAAATRATSARPAPSTPAPGPAPKSDAAAPSRPAPAPMTDGEKWGIRLPKPRRSAAPAREAPAPAPAPTAARSAQGQDESETGVYVDELFARIRSEQPSGEGAEPDDAAVPAAARGSVAVAVRADAEAKAEPATDAEPEPDADEDDEPVDPATRVLADRDERLGAVERDLGRKLKRVLADEQNEVLDQLRRGGTIEFADVLTAPDEHVDRYAIAATTYLDGAAALGAELVGGDGAGSCDELAAALARLLVDPLRVRIEQSFVDSDGDLEEVGERLRALYREWKANHIGYAVRHFTASAYARGAYEATPGGEPLQWLVDSSCDACPDCDDNALAGQVAKGEAYPTGDRCAPAHPDCRCLVVPVALLDTE
jgi:hypothetical protein